MQIMLTLLQCCSTLTLLSKGKFNEKMKKKKKLKIYFAIFCVEKHNINLRQHVYIKYVTRNNLFLNKATNCI